MIAASRSVRLIVDGTPAEVPAADVDWMLHQERLAAFEWLDSVPAEPLAA